MSWQQVRDILMKLMEMQNPIFLQAMMAPENLPIIREALGLNDFYIPGEEDMEKQYEETQLLLNSEPIPSGVDEMGQPTEAPSVDIDPEFDNHQIHFELVRKWVVSSAGRLAKNENPRGYMNVLLHGREHKMIIDQQAMMQQQQAEIQRGAPGRKPNELKQEAPITGDSNVQTTQ